MLAIHYIECIGNKVCIKAFAQNFIDAKGFKLCLKSRTVEFT